MKIGFLIIGTNKYADYAMSIARQLHAYVQIPNAQIHCFIFTNRSYLKENKNDTILHIHHTPWPLPTLLRYHVFQQNYEYWADMDYVFYIDADMAIKQKIGPEILGTLTATQHPGFFNKSVEHFTYDNNPTSMAYIDKRPRLAYEVLGEGTNIYLNEKNMSYYFAGGFNGGTTKAYKEMIDTIVNWINQDLSRHYIALWHDESYLNKYLNTIFNKDHLNILDPSYCFPENSDIAFSPIIVALNKNHEEMRK